jgi:threonine dehydrogenase-like Zn-dependent dehydrogenase
MRALLFGVEPDPYTPSDPTNPLMAGMVTTPMKLTELEEPHPQRSDWVMAKTRLTGICGSDAKHVFQDFGEGNGDNPMNAFFTYPTVLGHEVVAEVVELGPDARGLEIGQRVVLNPWLTCGPRGIDPKCAACAEGDLSLCHNFLHGRLAAGMHTGLSRDATGGFAEFLPAHDSMFFPVPDSIPDEVAVMADPFAVSLHSVTRHSPPPGGKAMVYGAGALGTCATAILRALHPDVEVLVVARFPAQAALARSLGATVVDPGKAADLIEGIVAWSGGTLLPASGGGLPMAHPGGIDVVYDTVGTNETAEVAVRVLKARGTLVKSGVNAPGRWEWTPLYFKEISWVGSNAFGVEEVDGVRMHGIAHYLKMVEEGRIDISPMLTHTFRLEDWHSAFEVLATQQESGAIKVAFDFR